MPFYSEKWYNTLPLSSLADRALVCSTLSVRNNVMSIRTIETMELSLFFKIT